MAEFEPALARLLKIEGGYAAKDNHNGAVNRGITAAFLRLIHDPRDPKDLTEADTAAIYRHWFWDLYQCGRLDSQGLAEAFFFAVVNCEPVPVVKALQRAVGAMDDGIQGPRTIATVNAKPPLLALMAFREQLKAHYRAISPAGSENERLRLAGWLRRAEL